jgi:tetratricopeptide (TPR) repeat protein
VDHYGLNKFLLKNENYRIILRKLLGTIAPIAFQKQQRFYSVPFSTVETYTERQKLSIAVEEKLHVHHPNASVPHALAIYGLGGTGKTQLALKYIEDNKDEYNPILWIDAKDEQSVRSGFERCASELQLQVTCIQPQSTSLADSTTVQDVLRWLQHRTKTDDKWLVVFDNADDLKWRIIDVMPKGDQGTIIITSQDSQSRKLVSGGCEEVHVATMEPLEARELLLQHLKLDLDLMPEETLQDCDKIAEQLGYLALAVDLAGAYIGNDNDDDKREALRRYPADYEKHQDDLLQSEDFRGLSASDKTVWTVWDTTLEKIEQRHADLRPGLLLAFLARFSGKILHEELFRLASSGMSTVAHEMYDGNVELPAWLTKILAQDGNEWDDFYYRKSRDVLIRYSLLQRAQGEWPGVTMHGLVRWRATKLEEAKPWDCWHLMATMAACVHLLEDEARPQFRRHMVVYLSNWNQECLNRLGIVEEKMPYIWNNVGKTYFSEGRWKKAEELFTQVIQTRKRVLGEEHPDTLTSMADLASTLWSQGRWKEGEELEARVMEMRKRVLGEEHIDTLTSMGNLASMYRDQERGEEAEEMKVQLIKTSSKMLASKLDIVANLALTYRNEGQQKEAEELEEQLMETKDRMQDMMANLASMLRNEGRLEEAEEPEVKEIETRMEILGEGHPDTLTSTDNLASTLRETEELSVHVMETSVRNLGKEHPDTLIKMSELASTYKSQGRWKESEELDVQVVEIRKRVLGEEHPDTLTGTAKLAVTYRNQGQWEEAAELEEQAMEIRNRVLGEGHPETLASMANLAATYRDQGRWEEATALEEQAVETSSTVLGKEHPSTLNSISNLATTYRNQRQWDKAAELEEQAM